MTPNPAAQKPIATRPLYPRPVVSSGLGCGTRPRTGDDWHDDGEPLLGRTTPNCCTATGMGWELVTLALVSSRAAEGEDILTSPGRRDGCVLLGGRGRSGPRVKNLSRVVSDLRAGRVGAQSSGKPAHARARAHGPPGFTAHCRP
jgi:hypothetical protein